MSQLSNWFLVIGAVLVSMALVGSVVKRLPFTPAILYLAFGYAVGTGGTGVHPIQDAGFIRSLTEVGMAIALFAVGLKLRSPLKLRAWRVPLCLGLPAMVVTIAVFAVIARLICGFPWSIALILAAVLAPTDPVLGSDVQVERTGDGDHVRFGLTGEGGLNDGLAAPVVWLGLGMAGLHGLGPWGTRWLLVEGIWFIAAGMAIGGLVSLLTARLVLYLRRSHAMAVGLEEFLGFGLIGLSFGLAGLLHASEFLAVFAAGVAFRHVERRTSMAAGVTPGKIHVAIDDEETATSPERAAFHLTETVLAFNAQAEHIAELALVTVLGALLANVRLEWQAIPLAAALFLVARPAAVAATLAGARTTGMQTWLIAWFGIRGIGSLYYLAVVLQAGVPEPWASRLASLVLTVVAISIVVHGVSATPLMHVYGRKVGRGRR
ncbi:MAG: sodium/hydrogen exchanger [Rhodocyclaceae bacterium]|nr:sodium/hydrogen exchanger [Rhodocyclaceae bacterium]